MFTDIKQNILFRLPFWYKIDFLRFILSRVLRNIMKFNLSRFPISMGSEVVFGARSIAQSSWEEKEILRWDRILIETGDQIIKSWENDAGVKCWRWIYANHCPDLPFNLPLFAWFLFYWEKCFLYSSSCWILMKLNSFFSLSNFVWENFLQWEKCWRERQKG